MRGRGGAGRSRVVIDFGQKLRDWSGFGLKIGALAFLASVAYMLYAVYGGHLAGPVSAKVTGNLQLIGQIMAVSGIVGTICLVIVTYEEIAVAVVAGLIGVGLVLGFPLMVAGQVSSQSGQAGGIITNWSAITGQAMVLIVGIRILVEIINYVREAPARRARLQEEQGFGKPKKATGRPLHRLSHCWEMPFCHDAIKEMCPAFKNRKNCWRMRQGCNCDPYLIESLLKRGASLTALPEQGSTYVRSDLELGANQPGSVRTRECRFCPIFNEHQREKFNLLNPIVIAGTVVGLIAAYPIMRALYARFIAFLAQLAERLVLGETVAVADWIERFDSPAVWTFFYIIVALLVLSYVLKFLEWAVLVRKAL